MAKKNGNDEMLEEDFQICNPAGRHETYKLQDCGNSVEFASKNGQNTLAIWWFQRSSFFWPYLALGIG